MLRNHVMAQDDFGHWKYGTSAVKWHLSHHTHCSVCAEDTIATMYTHILTRCSSSSGVRTSPVDTPWSEDRQEQHCLNFFVKNSAPQLAGYFDSPFWQRMVLQAGRHEPAVRHAIAAIGALHEKLLTGAVNPDQSQDSKTRFALEQCNKSIQHLVKPETSQTKPDLQLMLTTCVLFTCFEALQGHCEQAIIHATQGYSLLQQYAMVSPRFPKTVD